MSAEERDMGLGECGDNAAPYVLGALPDAEHERFVRHLQSCAVCREEVAALQLVADALAAAAPQVSAPAELRRRVMASVREDVRRAEAERTRAARDAVSSRLPGALRARWQAGVAVGALAAVLVVAVLLLGSGSGAPARVIRAQVLVPRASASLSVRGDRAQLSVAGMPSPGRGRVYEVWRKGAGAPQPTDALFTLAAGGRATVSVPGGVGGLSEVLVTSEPLGGSRVPTRAPVIVARV